MKSLRCTSFIIWNVINSQLSKVYTRRALVWSTYWAVPRSEIFTHRGQNWGPKLHPGPGVDFFGPWSFIILKNSHQDLSNEGSNFILSQLKVGHWLAQTCLFFDKFPEITDFGLLQQSQNRARFWICSVLT